MTCARVSLLHHKLLPEPSLRGGSNSTCASSFRSSAASLSGLLLPPSVSSFWKYELGFPPLHAPACSPLAESHHLSVHAYTCMLTYVPMEKYLLGFVCSFSHLPRRPWGWEMWHLELCCHLWKDRVLTTLWALPTSMTPEVITGKQFSSVTCWSLSL